DSPLRGQGLQSFQHVYVELGIASFPVVRPLPACAQLEQLPGAIQGLVNFVLGKQSSLGVSEVIRLVSLAAGQKALVERGVWIKRFHGRQIDRRRRPNRLRGRRRGGNSGRRFSPGAQGRRRGGNSGRRFSPGDCRGAAIQDDPKPRGERPIIWFQ